MSKATSAFVQANDPGYKDHRTAVTKYTVQADQDDAIAVNACEDGINGGKKVVVVLSVNVSTPAKASVDQLSGAVMLEASGSGTPQFLVITLDSIDQRNWTVQVKTSGGSHYTFKKGVGID